MILRLIAVGGLMVAAVAAQAAPAKPKPAAALLITNARAVPATEVTIEAGDQSVKLAKPLAAKAKASLKLPKMSGCMVAVAATFADDSVVEFDEFDVCKEKTVRFTD
jgi:hypothetical protein